MTKFTIKRETVARKEPKEYEVIREYKKEREHVMKLEKELHAHEKTDDSRMRASHPIPSLRRS